MSIKIDTQNNTSNAANGDGSAKQFVNNLITNNDFAMNYVQQIVQNSENVSEYLKAQGYNLQENDLSTALNDALSTNIIAWAGIYKFDQPGNYKNKKLRILSKENQVLLDDQQLNASAIGNATFCWTDSDNNIVTVTFSEHINDDGTVNPNTFTGNIQTTQSNNTISGIQVVTDPSDSSDPGYTWMDWLGFSVNILSFLGIYPLVKANKKAYEAIKEKLAKTSASVSDGVSDEICSSTIGDLDINKDEYLNEIENGIRNVTQSEIKKLDLDTEGQINLNIDEIVEKVYDEQKMDQILKTKISEKFNLAIKTKINQIEQLPNMEGVSKLFDNHFKTITTEIVDKLTQQVKDSLPVDYIKRCIRQNVLYQKLIYINNNGGYIQNQLTTLSENQTKTQTEIAEIDETIARKQSELRVESHELNQYQISELKKKLEEHIQKQIDLKKQKEEIDRTKIKYERMGEKERADREFIETKIKTDRIKIKF